MASKITSKVVDGNNIIYHYIQKKLLIDDGDLSKELIKKLLTDLSIWLPSDLYKQIPILLPYVIRDSSCRKSVNNLCEEWGSSNSDGYLRDDNSLIKGLVKSFKIVSPNVNEYNRKKIGNGFVASHIWQEIEINNKKMLASNNCKTYSFVPNLVWLPKQISKLTDRQGSYAQKILQNLSYEIYYNLAKDIEIKNIWNFLPHFDMQLDLNAKKLNFFEIPENWMEKRKNQLVKEIEIIEKTLNNNVQLRGEKVKCSRYLPTLINADNEKKFELASWLNIYKTLLDL